MTLLINEIFETIQGEGSKVGSPAVFMRLHGCPVGCPWCDTAYTWDADADQKVSLDAIVGKKTGTATWADAPTDWLVDQAAACRSKLVVITGGEPCMNDLRILTKRLIAAGKQVQIETSGTYDILCDPLTWVTVSPKVAMPGGREVMWRSLERADELKMPVGRMHDIDVLKIILRQHTRSVPVFLQPLSVSHKATEFCIEQATENGWRVSLQAHALLGIR